MRDQHRDEIASALDHQKNSSTYSAENGTECTFTDTRRIKRATLDSSMVVLTESMTDDDMDIIGISHPQVVQDHHSHDGSRPCPAHQASGGMALWEPCFSTVDLSPWQTGTRRSNNTGLIDRVYHTSSHNRKLPPVSISLRRHRRH